MAKAVIERYTKAGAHLGTITAELLTCTSEYAPYGGCKNASLTFKASWGTPLVTGVEEALVVTKDNLPVFAGPVMSIDPSLHTSVQKVELDGWYRRLDEIEIVAPPVDKIVFGVPGGDYPDAVKAFDVVRWILDNKILPDDKSSITEGQVIKAAASCKLGPSGFVIYANDNLTKILETLALLDDCIYGIDALQQFYFFPRSLVEADTLLTVTLAEVVGPGWRTQPRGIITDGTFVEDRSGPNYIAVQSRDINTVPGTRTYKLAGTSQDGTRRKLNYYSPNIRHGQAARRLARGLFRRYTDYGLKAEDVQFFTGTRRLEPHLGAVSVTDGGVEAVRKIAGSISVSWEGVIKGTVSLGDNKPEAGSGDANDPFSTTDNDASDSPQIDTGDTSVIDFGDGWEGDGDDLHFNDDRLDWTDEPLGLDYGEDTVDPTNGQQSGSSKARGVFVRIKELKPGNRYDIEEMDPLNPSSVLKTHSDVEAWPETATFKVNQQTLGYFFADEEAPRPVGNEGCCNDHYYFVGQIIKD